MLAGVSTRRYTRLQEPVGTAVEAQSKSTAKSSGVGVKMNDDGTGAPLNSPRLSAMFSIR
jgi:hypothetical protein